ncbi:MAG: molecular chaperone HscB [Chthoniobacter sp.]|nr:molecular chaperone HscB [Chthoniobacter sp.]
MRFCLPLCPLRRHAMTDHFTVLQQPRRPWLDADALKDVFHRRSAALHPDVPGTGETARFASLSAAYTALREPASRLRHLLELDAPELLSATAPPPTELADLFMRLAGQRRRLDQFIAQRAAASSPLGRALLAGEAAVLRRDLAAMTAAVEAAHSAALEDLRALDAIWNASDPAHWTALSVLHDRLTYLGKWLGQLRESLFTLNQEPPE